MSFRDGATRRTRNPDAHRVFLDSRFALLTRPGTTLVERHCLTTVMPTSLALRSDRTTGACLLDLGRNLLQGADEFLPVAFTDQLIEVTLVPARATRHVGENLFSSGRQVQAIRAAVSIHASAFDQTAPHQIFNHRRKTRFVAPIGKRKFGLTDAGIAGDQCQSGKPTWALADLL